MYSVRVRLVLSNEWRWRDAVVHGSTMSVEGVDISTSSLLSTLHHRMPRDDLLSL